MLIPVGVVSVAAILCGGSEYEQRRCYCCAATVWDVLNIRLWKCDHLLCVDCATSRTTAMRRAGELKTWLLPLIQTCRRATTEEFS